MTGRDVQAGLDEHRHGVPGLEHLAPEDALDREHRVDDAVPVEGDVAGGQPQQGDLAAVRHRLEHRVQGGRRAGHLQPDVEPLDHAELVHDLVEGLGRATLTVRVTPIVRASSSRYVADVGDHDVPGARVPHDRRGHDADRPGAGDEDVLAEHRERQRGVDGVAERVEDRGHVGVDGRGCRQTFVAGTATYSAKPPSRSTPTLTVFGHSWRRAGAAVAAAAADDVPFDADEVADVDGVDAAPTSATGRRSRARRPAAAYVLLRPRRPTSGCAGRCRRCRCAGPGRGPRRPRPAGSGTSCSQRPGAASALTRAFIDDSSGDGDDHGTTPRAGGNRPPGRCRPADCTQRRRRDGRPSGPGRGPRPAGSSRLLCVSPTGRDAGPTATRTQVGGGKAGERRRAGHVALRAGPSRGWVWD